MFAQKREQTRESSRGSGDEKRRRRRRRRRLKERLAVFVVSASTLNLDVRATATLRRRL